MSLIPTVNQSRLVMGIDPGLSGAIAIVSHALAGPRLVGVWDMPTLDPVIKGAKGPKGKRNINTVELAILIDSHSRALSHAVVEDVGVMSGDEGTVSMFRFGMATGIVHGILAGCFVPTMMTKPAVWKSLMGLNQNKGLSREKASAMFPEHADNFKRKKDDGRAEAVLLAVFGGRLL